MVRILASVVGNIVFLLEQCLHEEARGWSRAPWECQHPVGVQPSHLLPMLISFLVVNMEETPKCYPFPHRGPC